MASHETPLELLDCLLAGSSAEELQPSLLRLPLQERDALLCTACGMREEVAANCRDRAEEIGILLRRNCSYHASDTWLSCPLVAVTAAKHRL